MKVLLKEYQLWLTGAPTLSFHFAVLSVAAVHTLMMKRDLKMVFQSDRYAWHTWLHKYL
jgi:hypothetical protein